VEVVSFKDQAALDLLTFVNVNEFGDTVNIDGEPVACVLEGNDDTTGSDVGVTDVDTILHARASDFYKVPSVGQRISVDERLANVVGVAENQGAHTLRLKWQDS
jgi:hypothetical protein